MPLHDTYTKLLEFHEREFPDWSLPQLMAHFERYKCKHGYCIPDSDERFIELMQRYADEAHREDAADIVEQLRRL